MARDLIQPPEEFMSEWAKLWAKILAIQILVRRGSIPADQLKAHLDFLDTMHESLLNAVDTIEELANYISAQLPRDSKY